MKFLVALLEGLIFSILATILISKLSEPPQPGNEAAAIVYLPIYFLSWAVISIFFIIYGIGREKNKNAPTFALGDKIILLIALILAILFVLTNGNSLLPNLKYILQNRSLI